MVADKWGTPISPSVEEETTCGDRKECRPQLSLSDSLARQHVALRRRPPPRGRTETSDADFGRPVILITIIHNNNNNVIII